MPIALVVCVAAVLALMVAEWRGARPAVWVAKPLASAAFCALALRDGWPPPGHGRWIVVALLLAAVGDVLLIPRARAAFLGGLVAFLLGHLGFVAAFVDRGLDGRVTGLALAFSALPALLALRWLWPHLPGVMRGPVVAYVVVISVMAATAVGTHFAHAAPVLLGAAFAFYVSDLSVARDRFVAPGFGNRLWGLPLYYGAQIAFAWTVLS